MTLVFGRMDVKAGWLIDRDEAFVLVQNPQLHGCVIALNNTDVYLALAAAALSCAGADGFSTRAAMGISQSGHATLGDLRFRAARRWTEVHEQRDELWVAQPAGCVLPLPGSHEFGSV